MSTDKTRKSHKKLGQYWNYIEIYLSTEFSRNTQIMLAKHRCSAIVTRWTCVVFHRSFFFFLVFLSSFSFPSFPRCAISWQDAFVTSTTLPLHHHTHSDPFSSRLYFNSTMTWSFMSFHTLHLASPRALFLLLLFLLHLLFWFAIIILLHRVAKSVETAATLSQIFSWLSCRSLARSLERVYSFLHCLTDRFIFPHFVPIPAFFCLLFSRPLFLLLHLCFPLSITIRRR